MAASVYTLEGVSGARQGAAAVSVYPDPVNVIPAAEAKRIYAWQVRGANFAGCQSCTLAGSTEGRSRVGLVAALLLLTAAGVGVTALADRRPRRRRGR